VKRDEKRKRSARQPKKDHLLHPGSKEKDGKGKQRQSSTQRKQGDVKKVSRISEGKEERLAAKL